MQIIFPLICGPSKLRPLELWVPQVSEHCTEYSLQLVSFTCCLLLFELDFILGAG